MLTIGALMGSKMNKKLLSIQILSILAMVISSVLLHSHYKEDPSKFCVFGDKFDCDIVNKSIYSELSGIFHFISTDLGIPFPQIYLHIPVSLISILVFLTVLTITFRIPKSNKPKRLLKTVNILMLLSILFSIYLLYIEMFILLAYCIYCIALNIIILLTYILSLK